jgi:hypothetical protein
MRNRLAAFVVGRRFIAAAVFEGLKLSFWQVRSFQASPGKASTAVTAFVSYIIERCEIESAGLEETPAGPKTRAADLVSLVQNLLREHNIPTSAASEDVLYASFSYPPIYSRATLRNTALQLFPQLREPSSNKEVVDAALLGLYLQTERLLSDY